VPPNYKPYSAERFVSQLCKPIFSSAENHEISAEISAFRCRRFFAHKHLIILSWGTLYQNILRAGHGTRKKPKKPL